LSASQYEWQQEPPLDRCEPLGQLSWLAEFATTLLHAKVRQRVLAKWVLGGRRGTVAPVERTTDGPDREERPDVERHIQAQQSTLVAH